MVSINVDDGKSPSCQSLRVVCDWTMKRGEMQSVCIWVRIYAFLMLSLWNYGDYKMGHFRSEVFAGLFASEHLTTPYSTHNALNNIVAWVFASAHLPAVNSLTDSRGLVENALTGVFYLVECRQTVDLRCHGHKHIDSCIRFRFGAIVWQRKKLQQLESPRRTPIWSSLTFF
jgi:hypothetical protein